MGSGVDDVVVGAGAVSLVAALRLARAGRRVAIVEASDRIGGAWATHTMFGVDGIEIAPHVFMPDAFGYRVMRDFVPTDYEPVPKARTTVSGSRWLADQSFELASSPTFYLKWGLATRMGGSGGLPHRALRTGGFVARRLLSFARRPVVEPVMYPKGGLKAWLAAIEAEFQRLGVDLTLNTRIASIECREDQVRVEAGDGRFWSGERLVLTRRASLDRLVAHGQEIPIRRREGTLTYVAFLVSGAEESGLVLHHGHPFLSIAADTTRFLPPAFAERHPGCRLVSVRSNLEGVDDRTAATIFEALKSTGFIGATAICRDAQLSVVSQSANDRQTLARLRKGFGRRALLVPFGDLGLTSNFL